MAEHVGMLVVFLYSGLYPLPQQTFPRLGGIAPAKLWSKASLPAWRNPDHQVQASWVLPVYWERLPDSP